MTQAATPPPHLALKGASPRPPEQPQEQTPVDDPQVEVEIKPQLKPRGSVTKEDPKPSHQLHKLQIKSARPTRQTLCLWNVLKVIESSHKRRRTCSDSCGHWRPEHTGEGPDESLNSPHSRSGDQHSVGGHPREVRRTDAQRGKGLWQPWLKKQCIVPRFWLVLFILLDFFLFSFLLPLCCHCWFYWH